MAPVIATVPVVEVAAADPALVTVAAMPVDDATAVDPAPTTVQASRVETPTAAAGHATSMAYRVRITTVLAKPTKDSPIGVTWRSEGGRLVVTCPPDEGSPAAKAGIKQGDVAVSVNGFPVNSLARARELLSAADKSVEIEVARLKVKIKLADGSLPIGLSEDDAVNLRSRAPPLELAPPPLPGRPRSAGPATHAPRGTVQDCWP